mmetsp:Transcript_25245/g.57497  ORF Transcript_25245/g.57497 Transcript_25245/m.57497 type:complete len:231 (+) Transcript_25245:902-1594(+)
MTVRAAKRGALPTRPVVERAAGHRVLSTGPAVKQEHAAAEPVARLAAKLHPRLNLLQRGDRSRQHNRRLCSSLPALQRLPLPPLRLPQIAAFLRSYLRLNYSRRVHRRTLVLSPPLQRRSRRLCCSLQALLRVQSPDLPHIVCRSHLCCSPPEIKHPLPPTLQRPQGGSRRHCCSPPGRQPQCPHPRPYPHSHPYPPPLRASRLHLWHNRPLCYSPPELLLPCPPPPSRP